MTGSKNSFSAKFIFLINTLTFMRTDPTSPRNDEDFNRRLIQVTADNEALRQSLEQHQAKERSLEALVKQHQEMERPHEATVDRLEQKLAGITSSGLVQCDEDNSLEHNAIAVQLKERGTVFGLVDNSLDFKRVKVGDVGEISRGAKAGANSQLVLCLTSLSLASLIAVHDGSESILDFLGEESNSGTFRRKVLREREDGRVVFW